MEFLAVLSSSAQPVIDIKAHDCLQNRTNMQGRLDRPASSEREKAGCVSTGAACEPTFAKTEYV